MKDSKLYTILSALKDKQISLVEKKLKEEKRKSLFALFQLLRNAAGNIPDKEVVFYKVFRKKYTADNDYILRNEMRLLIEKIESILIAEQLEKTIEKNTLFRLKQQLLLHKTLDLFDIYTETWKEAKTMALDQYQYQEILELNADYFEFAQFHIRNYKERLELFDKLTDENILYTNCFFAQQYAYNSFIEGNANKLRLEYQATQQHKIPTEKTTLHLDKFASPINEYYTLVGEWFPHQSKGKTALLLKALSILEKCNKNSTLYKQEHLRILYLIATDFSMSANFEQAAFYFEKLFSEVPSAQLHNKAYYFYNYAVNLTKLGQYEKALVIISDAEKHIRPSNEFLKDKYQLLKVICFMFTKDAAQLKKLIPTDFSVLLPEQRVYFRFVNTIYYLITHNFDLAAEEINNLLRSKLINEIDIHFLSVAKFYKNALNLILKENTFQLSANSIKRIRNEATAIDNNEPAVVANYMPYKWMKAALKI